MKYKRIATVVLSAILCLMSFMPVFASGVEPAPLELNIKDCLISHKESLVYIGQKQEPKVMVTYEGEKLKEGKDYSIKYKSNKSYGTATVTIKGMGAFSGSATSKFKICPKKAQIKRLKSDYTMRFKAEWKRNKKVDGYRLEYSLNKDFAEYKYKTVKNNNTLVKTVRGVEAGKKYYVRIKTYKETRKGRVYSDYSKVKTVKIKNPKHKTSKKNKICLTFDDGPSFVTEEILDKLKANNIKATFFIVNYNKEQKPIVQRIIDEGHTLAIHNYSHNYRKIYKSTSAYMKYHNKLYKKIKKDFEYEAKIMRFPGGTSNTVSRNYSYGIMKKLAKKVTKKGFVYFDWNIDSGDATGYNISKSKIANNTIRGLNKNSTNIVLMHDSGTKQTTAKALQKIIDYGNNNGYVFEAITEETQKIQHKPNN